MEIEINKIKPDKEQPRKTFDEESLKFLAESILSNGLITPIDIDEDYSIIDGERRWRAFKLAKLKTIPVRIVKLKKDKVQRLKRQLISDLQNDDVPTGERYEAIVRLYKLYGPDITQEKFSKELGISYGMINSALDYCDFAEQEPELAKSVSPHIISETKSLPKEEREEIIKEFKNIPKEDKKKDLIRELVRVKKKEIEDKKELEELKFKNEALKKAREKEIKIETSQDVLKDIREGIYKTHNELSGLMSRIRRVRKTKFYLHTPKEKDNFLKFLGGASERARKWADELDDLRETIEIEILRE